MAPRTVDSGWVGVWSAPADAAVGPPAGTNDFADRTLRTVVRPSVTGTSMRIRLSNEPVARSVGIRAVSVAAQSGDGMATVGAPVKLKFNGADSWSIQAGGEVYSDPIPMPDITGGSGNYLVSIHLANAVDSVPVHSGTSARTFLATGDKTADTTGATFTTSLTGSYFLSRVDVQTDDAAKGTIVVLGDHLSATAAPGSPTWVDNLPAKLRQVDTVLPGGLVNASRNGVPDTARWKLNDGSGTTARDSAGTAHATTAGGVTWSTEQNGSVNLSNGHLATHGPVLDTRRNYSVSTWVKFKTQPTRNMTFISQAGNTAGSFYLQYSAGAKTWAFISPATDTTSPASFPAAMGADAPAINQWIHLAGTYNASTGSMLLYVNGKLVGSGINTTPWTGTGPLVIGSAKNLTGNPYDLVDGSMADVRVHQRTLSLQDVEATYAEPRPGTYGPYVNTGAVTAASAVAALESSAKTTPNLRTVLMAVGGADILAGALAATVQQNMSNALKASSPAGVKRTLRPDGSPVHVILTTVPPLGLDANDPREVQRRQLNNLILNNFTDFGSDDVVDFDAAVRSGADQSKIDGQYLTNGVLNDRYHDRIAQIMAEACADFPPRAEL